MRAIGFVAVIIGLVTWAAHPPGSLSEEPRKVRYGTTASASHLPIWVAREAGLFARQGLVVEPIHIRGGALITMAIMSGSLQFSGAGAESVLAARIKGGDVVLLACPVDIEPVYLVARPEISSPALLKGKATGVTRLGSSTHFYLRAALRRIGLDPEKDVTILQLGAGGDIAAAMENGTISAFALPITYALPFMRRGWPVLMDLTKTDLIYPASCVTSSRQFLKQEPRIAVSFLRGYVGGIDRIKKDRGFTERVFSKVYRETDSFVIKKTVEAYTRIFKRKPYVSDDGIETVLRDLSTRSPVSKEFFGHLELFRDNRPLEKALKER